MTDLQLAVLKQLGFIGYTSNDNSLSQSTKETLQDINNHGIDGGFGDFIYYSDTTEFFDNNRAEIVEALRELASDLGEDMFEMVSGFGCLNGDYDTYEIADVVCGNKDDKWIKNALAWFAAETVARELVDY